MICFGITEVGSLFLSFGAFVMCNKIFYKHYFHINFRDWNLLGFDFDFTELCMQGSSLILIIESGGTYVVTNSCTQLTGACMRHSVPILYVCPIIIAHICRKLFRIISLWIAECYWVYSQMSNIVKQFKKEIVNQHVKRIIVLWYTWIPLYFLYSWSHNLVALICITIKSYALLATTYAN